MAERYIKSLFWLIVCSGTGYGLLKACTPSDNDIKTLSKTIRGAEKSPYEVTKKKEQFISVLQSATTEDKPFYRMNKEEIDRALGKK